MADADPDQAGDLLVSQIKQLGQDGPVTVVAHSMGGTVLTRAARQVPGLVTHAVYVSRAAPMPNRLGIGISLLTLIAVPVT